MFVHINKNDGTADILSELKKSDPDTMIFQSDLAFMEKKYSGYRYCDFFNTYPKNKNTFHNLSIIEAVYKHNLSELEILLKDENASPDFCQNLPIVIASAFGYVPVIKILLAYPRVNITDRSDAAVKSAVQNGHMETVRFILDLYMPNKSCFYYLCHVAIQNEHLEILKLLCTTRPDINFTHRQSYLISSTLEIHDETTADIFFEFVLEITGINISGQHGDLLTKAVENNKYRIAKRMLNNIIPRTQLNKSLIVAIKKNNLSMTKLLLSDDRADPAAKSNLAIVTASKTSSDNSIIKLLLADPRVCLSVKKNIVLINSIENKSKFELLLADPRIKTIESNIIEKIIKKEKIDLLKIVLASDKIQYPIRLTFMKFTYANYPTGHVCASTTQKEIIKLCSADHRYDPSSNSYLLWHSIKHYDTSLCKLLLEDPRTSLGVYYDRIFYHGSYYITNAAAENDLVNFAMLMRHRSINLIDVRNDAMNIQTKMVRLDTKMTIRNHETAYC